LVSLSSTRDAPINITIVLCFNLVPFGPLGIPFPEDGKLMADAGAGEFWGFFGGFAPLPRKTVSEGDKNAAEPGPPKLFW